MASLLANIWRDSRGQDMTEYALIAGLLSCVAVTIVPEMFSIAEHINEVLVSVAQTAAGIATLK